MAGCSSRERGGVGWGAGGVAACLTQCSAVVDGMLLPVALHLLGCVGGLGTQAMHWLGHCQQRVRGTASDTVGMR